MKIIEFENTLKEIEQPEISEKLNKSILDYSKTRLESESKQNDSILIINKFMLIIAGMIPFFEIFWYLNEKFIKKNNIKIKLSF